MQNWLAPREHTCFSPANGLNGCCHKLLVRRPNVSLKLPQDDSNVGVCGKVGQHLQDTTQ
ncbi:hypothetical protein E2C01_010269 [Portunus trituberculatus]|uniref:Uncharacterized protein n=1 Tax=Portunus trituberculatus TaxID=210409 RepID=A0A5B7D861_PORTR|nr:hypothetical protein [Portunus trituberculatus]